MTVILMTEGAGARSAEVAAGIAQSLGLELIEQQRVEQLVAERIQIDQSAVRRLIEGNASLLERWRVDGRRLSRYIAEEIVRLAVRGKVLIQCCGAVALLRPIRHVICVHICDPVRARARVTIKRPPPCESIASPEMHCADGLHTGRRKLFGSGLENPEHYHLVLNTARIPVDECVEQVRRLAESPHFQPNSISLAMLDHLLQETGSHSLLNSDAPCGRLPEILEVDVGTCRVRLSGISSNEQAVARIEEHLRGKHASKLLADHLARLPPREGII
jgi:cytidylate kinase